MREMDISQLARPANNLKQIRYIQTSGSMKPRSEAEILLLMRSTRNRFLKSLEEGRIQIISEREWTLK